MTIPFFRSVSVWHVRTACPLGQDPRLRPSCVHTSVVVFGLLLSGCVSRNDSEALRTRISVLEDSLHAATVRIAELENTPAERLARAIRLSQSRDEKASEEEYTALIDKYPQAPEARVARDSLGALRERREAQARAAERIQRLGFKGLAVTNDVTVGPTRMRVSSVRLGSRFISDRYDGSYHYRDVRRGYTYVLADVRITAAEDELNPMLPAIAVYKISGAYLYYVGTMSYQFQRWDDYGSYLGNTPDYGNDFSRTSTIAFNLGLEISDEDATGPLFLMVEKRNCASRTIAQFGSPEVSYPTYSCVPDGGLLQLTPEAAKNLFVVSILKENSL